MAEAAVDDISTEPAPKYYCHNCSSPVDISPDLPDLVCPKCESGFVEELTQNLQAEYANRQRRPHVSHENRNMASILSGFLLPPTDDIDEETDDDTDDDDREMWDRSSSQVRHRHSSHSRDPIRDRVLAHAEAATFSGFVEQLLRGLTSNTSSTGRTEGILPFLTPFFHGDPRDYAWGADGLDNAITQLLNQWEGSEIQPATKEAIDELQSMEVTQELVDKELQCSVCMEDFCVGEVLRCLPCQHLYHTGCIITWLEKHNSCPICRQSVGDSMVESAASVALPPSTDSSDYDDDVGTNQPTGSTSAASSSDSGLAMTVNSDSITLDSTNATILTARSRSSSSSSNSSSSSSSSSNAID